MTYWSLKPKQQYLTFIRFLTVERVVRVVYRARVNIFPKIIFILKLLTRVGSPGHMRRKMKSMRDVTDRSEGENDKKHHSFPQLSSRVPLGLL